MMENYLIASATDVGIARQVNEDSMIVFDSPNGHVMAVCDGMGGQAAGDVASKLAVNIIKDILSENTFASPEEAIKRSIMAANQGVLNRTAQNPELEGMGATCVMLIIKDGRVHCGWVGDSRIYYISKHTIRQISHDQSYVQQLVDSGQISKDEALNHPQKNEITNCIGLVGMTEPETTAVPIVPELGSVFLLCSDGLSGMVDEARIERVISSIDMPLQQKASRLIDMANEAGGLDNITVQLVQFSENKATGTSHEAMPESSVQNTAKKSHALIYGIIGAVLIAGASAGTYLFLKKDQPQSPTTTKIVTTPSTKTTISDPTDNMGTNTESQITQPSNQASPQSTHQKSEKHVNRNPVSDIKKHTKGSKSDPQGKQILNEAKKGKGEAEKEKDKAKRIIEKKDDPEVDIYKGNEKD